jgi:hypothetical protein
MTDLNRMNSGNLDAIRTTDGVVISANKDGAPSTFGVTLASGITYVFPLGTWKAAVPAEASYASTHFRWDASIIVTFTFETCNFPATVNPGDWRGPADVSDSDITAGNWMQENPSSGVYVSGSGSGGLTATNLTLVVAGGTAGGTTINLGNFGMRRGRWRALVGGTGGKVRCGIWGKGF